VPLSPRSLEIFKELAQEAPKPYAKTEAHHEPSERCSCC
jgi:hypothetical protein